MASTFVGMLMMSTFGLAAAPVTFKFAVITPDGSTWTNILKKMQADIATESKGAIEIKLYPGGVSGDELDVLRKMQANRLHGAGFSGLGLGAILPEIRVLEAPLLFRDYQELDAVKTKLFDTFNKGFEAKGFVLLGFAEAGFVYAYSKNKIESNEALKTIKMWVWKGDPVAEGFLNEFGIRTTPLHIADVIPGLETGMIDSFYAPPMAAIAFQWHTKAKYILDFPFVNATGALVVNKATFEQLSPELRTLFKTIAKKYSDEIVAATRQENQDARKILTDSGITYLAPSPKDVEIFQKNAEAVYKKNTGSLYSKDLFDKVSAQIKEIRKGK